MSRDLSLYIIEYAKIPWKDIAGMRDKVIHSYFGVNIEMIWLVVKEDIPKLKPLIEELINDFKR
ncbi:MAG: DUF86 domain-containing protein [Nitrospirae bacterium]|nr:DUF86 domain-containing protein [Nitrospirota bacterium]MBF0590636.1 DUF86 domain-containing protein [Nitrospirota bacterium]